jgi:shikimate kinase / 3-dehydroquinate synthase
MKRPVLLHGLDRELLCRLGGAIGSRLNVGFVDLFGQPWEAVSEACSGGAAPVVALRSEMLLPRVRRVEQLASSLVVAVGPWTGSRLIGQERGPWGEIEARRLDELVEREFRECHLFVGKSAGVEAEVVERIAGLAACMPRVVAAGERSYLVDVGRNVVEQGLSEVGFGGEVLLHLTDENVDRLHGARLSAAMAATGLRVVKHVLVPGEQQKCLGTLGEIFDRALAGHVDRSSWLVAAGGGVTTDIGGLASALWMRGLRWVAVPTTLLAMVDAAVGGKTAVDHGRGKNAVGAFWQPSRVICDVEFVLTESVRNYVGALAEVVKTALIGDQGLFEILEAERDLLLKRDLDLLSEVVGRCVQVKARIVGLDEREGGVRAVLNFGHTVGHALEALGDYRRYTHGEAVSLGMVVALRLGVRLGYTAMDVAKRVEDLLVGLGLPVGVSSEEAVASAELVAHDKKRAGNAIGFVFARGIGDVRTERIGLEDLFQMVRDLGGTVRAR